MKNPFPVVGYRGSKYFCDRQDETLTLTSAINASRNVTLAGPRRIGKTALIYHAASKLRRTHSFVYYDILSTSNLSEFVNGLINQITAEFGERTTLGKKIWSWIKSVRPVFTVDPFSGIPQVSLDLTTPDFQRSTLKELFSMLEKNNKKIIIALDEFQQITRYEERWLEAWLRSEIQELRNISFIFSGSHHGLLSAMFQVPSRPFYASTEFLFLDKIETLEYKLFIQKHLPSIKDKEIDYVLNWTRVHTYYVQFVCNRLYSLGATNLTRKVINLELNSILKQMDHIFFQYRELLTKGQWNLLYAIGKEEKVYEPTSSSFIQTYQLGNAASVRRALLSLEDKELIYKEITNEGSFYQVYDIFFMRWLQIILKIM